MLSKLTRTFARVIKKKGTTLPESVSKPKSDIVGEDKSVTKTGFDSMDIDQLQEYIDKAENTKKSKDVDLELLKKLESKSAKHYLQKVGVFTKGELKELAENKYIEINKKKADLESTIDLTTKIELRIKNPEKFIFPADMKLFLFFKPSDMISSKKDTKNLNRPTIFDYIKSRHNIKDELFCIVSLLGIP